MVVFMLFILKQRYRAAKNSSQFGMKVWLKMISFHWTAKNAPCKKPEHANRAHCPFYSILEKGRVAHPVLQ